MNPPTSITGLCIAPCEGRPGLLSDLNQTLLGCFKDSPTCDLSQVIPGCCKGYPCDDYKDLDFVFLSQPSQDIFKLLHESPEFTLIQEITTDKNISSVDDIKNILVKNLNYFNILEASVGEVTKAKQNIKIGNKSTEQAHQNSILEYEKIENTNAQVQKGEILIEESKDDQIETKNTANELTTPNFTTTPEYTKSIKNKSTKDSTLELSKKDTTIVQEQEEKIFRDECEELNNSIKNTANEPTYSLTSSPYYPVIIEKKSKQEELFLSDEKYSNKENDKPIKISNDFPVEGTLEYLIVEPDIKLEDLNDCNQPEITKDVSYFSDDQTNTTQGVLNNDEFIKIHNHNDEYAKGTNKIDGHIDIPNDTDSIYKAVDNDNDSYMTSKYQEQQGGQHFLSVIDNTIDNIDTVNLNSSRRKSPPLKKNSLYARQNEQPGSFTCPCCVYTAKHAYLLRRHIHTRHPHIPSGLSSEFDCPYCKKPFCNSRDTQNHINAVHLKVKPYACGFCDKSFVQKVQLKVHFRTHTIKG